MVTRFKWILVVLLAIASVAGVLYVNGTIFYLVSSKQAASDMRNHIIDAKLVIENRIDVIYKVSIGSSINIKNPKETGRYVPAPYQYPVFHYALFATKTVLKLYSYEIAWWYTMMITQIITLILTAYIIKINIQTFPMALPLSIILASMLFIVSSLYIPWYSPNMYLGYLNGNIYHNATTIIAKPIAYVAILAMATWLNQDSPTAHWKLIILTNVFVVLSALAKPNIPIAIIPAWSVLIAWRFITDPKKYNLQYAIYLLPIVITAITMYLQTRERFNDTYSFGIAWWYVAQTWTPNPFISMILTIAFPISVVLLYPHTIHNRLFQLTIVSFAVTVITYWMFYEIINYIPSNRSQNFVWGARMIGGLFFAIATAELVNAYGRIKSNLDYMKFGFATLLLLGHFISGVMFTTRIYSSKNFFF